MVELLTKMIDTFKYNNGNHELHKSQKNAILDGIQTRIQLLLGPPGTGKTMTTAISILTRIILAHKNEDIVIISGSTHLAINEILSRIESIKEEFYSHVTSLGINIPQIIIAKTDNTDQDIPNKVVYINNTSCVKLTNKFRKEAVLIVGGTINSILKYSEKLSNSAKFKTGFQTQTLIVDEASMLVFPSFLALSTITSSNSQIMLTGDHNQLSPIVSHDWEKEDRPPVVLYQPFLSAYDTIRKLSAFGTISEKSITLSALQYTYRLPEDVRNLIARLYKEDDVILEGRRDSTEFRITENLNWNSIWQEESGLYLISHNERESKKSNQTEIEIIQHIIDALEEQETTISNDTIAIVTPHRAQRTLLQEAFWDKYKQQIPIIDTVERLQGGEKDIIIVSATASNPSSITTSAQFILNINRANVAFSRSKKKLIVVCSETLLNSIPSNFEHYNSALLWKTIRRICSKKICSVKINDIHTANIFTINKDEIN